MSNWWFRATIDGCQLVENHDDIILFILLTVSHTIQRPYKGALPFYIPEVLLTPIHTFNPIASFEIKMTRWCITIQEVVILNRSILIQ